jgi:uncharacterized protein HemX
MLLGALVCVVALAVPAGGQEPTSSTRPPAVPSQDIIPRPDSGAAPQEAGDRGGALQLALLALLVVAIGGTVLVLVRQSRRARTGG